MNVRYVFTFSYPDPNRDNYLLDDTTESSLKLTARKADGAFTFDDQGLKGRLEFGREYLWLVIEENTDERFPVGHHGYEPYSPNQ